MALTRITKGVIKPNENYDTHNINSTGIITATKFVGPVTGAITGTAALASGLTGTPSITVQDVVAVGATFTGNVSIGGTLTYEDVTNIDSVGLVTARTGLVSPYADIDDWIDVGNHIQLGNAGIVTAKGADINGDLDVDGHTNLDNVSVAGVSTFSDDVKFSGAAHNITFDKSDNALEFQDAAKLKIGTDDDILLHHTGGYSYIEGVLRIGKNDNVRITDAADNTIIGINANAAYLNWNGNTKLTTTNTGAVVTGILTATDFSGAAGGAADFPNGLTGTTATFSGESTLGTVSITDYIYHAGDSNTMIRFPAADTFAVETAGSERLRIDSSGNIGQSVTPSGWASAQAGDFYAFQIGTGMAIFGRGSGDEDRGGISCNYYNTASAQKYIGNGHAGRIYFEDGSIVFSNAAQNSSGAGAAMTLNERLRIASNGKIGIGINPTARLHVNGLSTDGNIILARCADDNGLSSLNLLVEGTTGSSRILFSDTAATTGDAWISYGHSDRALTFTTAGTGNERLRINQSGNVCVNTADTGSIFGQSTPISTYSPKLGVQGSIIIGNLSSTTSDRYELQFYRRGGASGGTSITSHDMGRIAWYGSSNDNDNSNMAWAIGVTPNGGTWNAGSNRVGYMSFVNHDGEQLRIDSSGRLQLGSISGNSQWGQDIVNIESGGDAGISIGRLEGGSPSNGQQLGSYSFQSAIGSQNAGSAEAKITAFAAENQSGTTAATDMSFWVKASGTGPGSAPTERMRLDSTGRLILNPANGDFTNPDIGGSTAGVTINKNTTGQIYACTDAGGSAASNDGTSTVLNLCRRNGAGDGPQLALDRGGWIKASLAGLSGSNTASGGKGQFAIYTHDYSSGANVRYQRIRIDSGGVQNYTGGSADNYYANVQIRHKTPYSTDGGYPGSQQTSTNQTVFSLYNESYGGNKMAFRSGQGHQFEIETKTRDLGSGSYNDADVYFRSQYDASLTDRYIIGAGGGHTFQSRSKVTFGVGSGGDIWFGENPYNSQWSATNAGGWYYREDQTSMIVASRANTGYSTFYINKNTGAGGSTDTRWIDFYWNSSQYGRIEYNGASGTNYNTSSDYRLKENVVSITDGIAKVKQLKPYRFNFKSDTTDKVVQGFFAHEAQEVVPYAVNGTKDEVVTQAQVDAGSQPEDKAVGDPIYQNVDYAKFTPILTAALQEAIAKIEVLEAKVAALEGS